MEQIRIKNAVCHIDVNYFYGQIEALYRPDIRGKAFVVGGDQESRKGIVLTKSPEAKSMKIQTGSSIKDALKIYPNLIIVPANYPLYLHISQRMREIVLQYTDAIKPFGSDEMWVQLYGDRSTVIKTVQDIRQAIWKQLCMTVSIGVSNNLPYAKIGSDLAPNNGVFELWNEEREQKVYPLPVSDLLYVGQATNDKLRRHGINTIGELVACGPERICQILKNKAGDMLWTMAAGQDKTPVAHIERVDDVKSIGNSNTMPRDLVSDDDVRAAFYMLGESVAERMRESGFEAQTLKISVRDNRLLSFERQIKLSRPTNLAAEIVPEAIELFRRHYRWHNPVRSLGVRGTDLVPQGSVCQLSLFDDEEKRNKIINLERCVDRIRNQYGQSSLQRAVLMSERLKSVNANNDKGDAQTFYVYN
ncbi:MAG: DNA polymerase IV [Firmicutes bacterium]|nr:DNA polymerase IV [Bacillota bacterium]